MPDDATLGKTFIPEPVYQHQIAKLEALAVATASAVRHMLSLLADPEPDRTELARVGARISAALKTLGE